MANVIYFIKKVNELSNKLGDGNFIDLLEYDDKYSKIKIKNVKSGKIYQFEIDDENNITVEQNGQIIKIDCPENIILLELLILKNGIITNDKGA